MMMTPLIRIFLAITLCHASSALVRNTCARQSSLALFSVAPKIQDAAPALFDRNQETELLDVAIVGGGPTGLACALALLRASSTSSAPRSSIGIFESDSFEPKGASIVLSKMGWKTLKCIDKGTYKDAKSCSVPISLVSFRNFSGKNTLPVPITFVLRRLVRPVLRLIRKGLVRSNSWHELRLSIKRGVENVGSELGYSSEDLIRTNSKLVSVDPTSRSDKRVLLTFADGRKVAASTVLACDGTFSSVRKQLERFEEETGQSRNKPVLVDEKRTVWRGTVPSISAKGVGTFFIAQKEAKVQGATGCLFPAGGAADGSSLAIIAPTMSGRATSTEDARERLKKVLAGFEVPIAEELEAAIDAAEIMLEHKLHVRDPVAYPDIGSGYDRIAYFGDALHPLRPTGEGLAVAMEDAWTIGQLLANSETGKVSPELLRSYEEQREERVNAICLAVRNLAESYYDENQTGQDTVTNARSIDQAKKDHPIKLSPLY